MPSCTVLVPRLNKIWPCMSEKWLGTHLSHKMAASQPSWIWLRKKMRSIYKPPVLIFVPSLNNIGKCMSEKCLRTCSTLGFVQLKWPSVGHLGSDVENKWRAYSYVYHQVSSLCRGRIKSVHTCPRYGCGRTHRHENRDRIHEPSFRTVHWGLINWQAGRWHGWSRHNCILVIQFLTDRAENFWQRVWL